MPMLKYFISLGKVSGNFHFNVYRNVMDDKYDDNDLGITHRNNFERNGAKSILVYNSKKISISKPWVFLLAASMWLALVSGLHYWLNYDHGRQ